MKNSTNNSTKSAEDSISLSSQPFHASVDMRITRNYKSYKDEDDNDQIQAFLLGRLNLSAATFLYAGAVDTKNPESFASALQRMGETFNGLPFDIRFERLIPKAFIPVIQDYTRLNDISFRKTRLQSGIFPTWFMEKENAGSQSRLTYEARLAVKAFNDQPVPGLSVNRHDLLKSEHEHLKPLPKEKFDPVFSKSIKTQINGHVEVTDMYYPLPWEARFQPLTARYTKSWVKYT